MKTYKDINEFINDVFPLEYEKITKRKKTPIERAIGEVEALFVKELEEAIEGKKEEPKGQKPK